MLGASLHVRGILLLAGRKKGKSGISIAEDEVRDGYRKNVAQTAIKQVMSRQLTMMISVKVISSINLDSIYLPCNYHHHVPSRQSAISMYSACFLRDSSSSVWNISSSLQ